jgi:hypothetical protein
MVDSNEMDPRQVVQEWIEAVNAGDLAHAGALVSDSVEIVGPRGSTSGRDAVSAWVRHTGIRMATGIFRAEGDRVIVDARSTWQLDGGDMDHRTPEATIVMMFLVAKGKITTIERLESINDVPSR